MSRDNVEVVRGIYDAWNERATSQLIQLFDEAIEIRLNVMMGPYSGRDGVLRFVDDVMADWSELSMTIEDAVAGGDRVVVAVREDGIGRSSRVRITSIEHHVWTLRDGRAVRGVAYPSRAKALQAAGFLSSQDGGRASKSSDWGEEEWGLWPDHAEAPGRKARE
jgi:ketosteroid isomerase-like protein